jgi:hypothetical protein
MKTTLRAWAVSLSGVCLLACPPAPIAGRCGDGLPPCPAGQRCQTAVGNLAVGVCVEADAGAVVTERDAGAPVPGCDAGCPLWAVCVASGQAASCVDGLLVVSQPVEPTTLAASQPVTVEAQFLLSDGGPWPSTVAIPAQASWGAQTLLLSGIPGRVQGRSDAGAGTILFGWDGGPAVSRSLSFSGCVVEVSAACAPFEECAPSTAGGACVSHGYVVEWASPGAGAAFNQASVPAEVRVSKPDGGPVSLSAIPVSGAAPFTGAAGRYTGLLPLSAPDGVKTFVAGWPDGGPSREFPIERDTVAPEVTVFVVPRSGPDPDPVLPSAWKKDERVLLRVTVDGGRPAVPGDVRPPPAAVVTPEVCAGCSGACRCFGIDVSSSPLNGLRGAMGFRVLPIDDSAGNLAEPRDGGFEVTRLRWRRSAALSPFTFAPSLFAPAVSENGVVVLSLASLAQPGDPGLIAFDPAGNRLWSAVTTQEVRAPAVVSGDSVWVATFGCGTGGCAPGAAVRRVGRYSLADGGFGEARCNGPDVNDVFAAVGLGRLGTGPVIPVGVTGLHNLELGSTTCPRGPLPTNIGAAAVPAIALRPAGAKLEVFASAGSTLRWLDVDGTAWSLLDVRSGPVNFEGEGLALDAAGRLIAGGSSFDLAGGTGGVFVVSASAPVDGGVFINWPAMVSPPLVGVDAIYGVSRSGNVMRIPLTAQGVAATGVEAGPGLQSASQQLVLGNGRLLSVASLTSGAAGLNLFGTIRIAQMRASDLAFEWFADLDTLQADVSRVAPPALDVLRLDGGARDCSREAGVLYVVSSIGPTATLTSVIVDARGLDPSAPWPKFQRDNANSANASFSTAPWSCP